MSEFNDWRDDTHVTIDVRENSDLRDYLERLTWLDELLDIRFAIQNAAEELFLIRKALEKMAGE